MKQIIEPLDLSVSGLLPKINEIIVRLNWLLEVMPCHFLDGMCVIHASPQIFLGDGQLQLPIPTAYCGVAEAKMRARIELIPKG